jgi:hypothetical protein
VDNLLLTKNARAAAANQYVSANEPKQLSERQAAFCAACHTQRAVHIQC